MIVENSEATVFLIDDDPAILKVLPRALQKHGLEVRAFPSATEFLQSYFGAPGCLVLDLRMPEMTGLELQQELIKRKIEIPIIFITGHGGIRQSVQALKAGAIDFLEKPFLPEVLLQKIHEAFVQGQKKRLELHTIEEIQSRFSQLTEREHDVFELLNKLNTVDGIPSSKEIARSLDISHRTVEHHRARILEKTRTRSVAELLLLAKEVGVVTEGLDGSVLNAGQTASFSRNNLRKSH